MAKEMHSKSKRDQLRLLQDFKPDRMRRGTRDFLSHPDFNFDKRSANPMSRSLVIANGFSSRLASNTTPHINRSTWEIGHERH